MDEVVQQIMQPILAQQAELTLWEQLQAFYHAVRTIIMVISRV
jgi:hypothetical protein